MYQKQVEKLEAELSALKHECSNVYEERDEIKAKVFTLESERSFTNSNWPNEKKLREELAASKTEIIMLNGQINLLKAEIERLENDSVESIRFKSAINEIENLEALLEKCEKAFNQMCTSHENLYLSAFTDGVPLDDCIRRDAEEILAELRAFKGEE
jgi:chromosome segregation ATPase